MAEQTSAATRRIEQYAQTARRAGHRDADIQTMALDSVSSDVRIELVVAGEFQTVQVIVSQRRGRTTAWAQQFENGSLRTRKLKVREIHGAILGTRPKLGTPEAPRLFTQEIANMILNDIEMWAEMDSDERRGLAAPMAERVELSAAYQIRVHLSDGRVVRVTVEAEPEAKPTGPAPLHDEDAHALMGASDVMDHVQRDHEDVHLPTTSEALQYVLDNGIEVYDLDDLHVRYLVWHEQAHRTAES